MTQDISIRPATVSDVPALDDILFRAFDTLLRPDYPAAVLELAVPLMGRSRPDLVGSGTYYLATDDDGRVLGAGGWSGTDPHGDQADPRVGHIRHFGVDPSMSRRGVAKAIMVRVFEDAAAQGITSLMCFSTRGAVPFYRAMGFEVLDEFDVMLSEDVALRVVRMTRALP